MRSISHKQISVILVLFGFIYLLISCKSKHTSSTSTVDANSSSNSIRTKGTVSHQFKSSGCETVIVCIDKSDTVYLLPMSPLEKFNIDGLRIEFNYRVLRIHNPKGCEQGVPVQVSEIKKVNRSGK